MRRPQFSLKTTLWLMVMVGVACARFVSLSPHDRERLVWATALAVILCVLCALASCAMLAVASLAERSWERISRLIRR